MNIGLISQTKQLDVLSILFSVHSNYATMIMTMHVLSLSVMVHLHRCDVLTSCGAGKLMDNEIV